MTFDDNKRLLISSKYDIVCHPDVAKANKSDIGRGRHDVREYRENTCNTRHRTERETRRGCKERETKERETRRGRQRARGTRGDVGDMGRRGDSEETWGTRGYAGRRGETWRNVGIVAQDRRKRKQGVMLLPGKGPSAEPAEPMARKTTETTRAGRY
ncbi:hypothetical protein LSAT2_018389, partial [Lamellibrachia satsuma]